MEKVRNIAIFIDGTNQNRAKAERAVSSNVERLFNACGRKREGAIRQSRSYYEGIGVRGNERILGGVLGADLGSRVEEAYGYLKQEVGLAREKGEIPRIYLFGFSRGAFAVRWLASLVAFSGVPTLGASERKGFMNLLDGDREEAGRLRVSGEYVDIPIEMIGVWDTVKTTLTSDFGVGKLPGNVGCAYHAMALDEHRGLFDVLRFDPDPRVLEVWFYGSHSDVGGGYEDGAVTAEVALEWMMDRAEEHGLLLVREERRSDPRGIWSEAVPVYHDETSSSWGIKKVWTLIHCLMSGLRSGIKAFKRVVRRDDLIHRSVGVWKRFKPRSRPEIPRTCLVWNDHGDRSLFGAAAAEGRG